MTKQNTLAKSKQVAAKTQTHAQQHNIKPKLTNHAHKPQIDNQWATLKQSMSKQIKPAHVQKKRRKKKREAAKRRKGQKKERKRGRGDDRTQ